MKAYLLAYNAACGAGWLFCLIQASLMCYAGATYEQVYAYIGPVLLASQTAMLLEIVHSALGLVPSPVGTVAMQVMSRIFIVWGQLYPVPQCQADWSLGLIVFSWGITEVVRYTFYFLSLIGEVPFPVFYLRYSLFMVLYPSGISGEILMTLLAREAHWKDANPLWHKLSGLVLLTYAVAGPYMIYNMWNNRKRSFKKRAGGDRKSK